VRVACGHERNTKRIIYSVEEYNVCPKSRRYFATILTNIHVDKMASDHLVKNRNPEVMTHISDMKQFLRTQQFNSGTHKTIAEIRLSISFNSEYNSSILRMGQNDKRIVKNCGVRSAAPYVSAHARYA
jgi:D-ribose pyranose/furanose isomerase RbsD